MPTTEHTINDELAARLRETRHAWRDSDVVRSENTRMLKGNAKRPDILVLEPNVAPVCIETEVVPAVTLESDATARLGEELRSNGRKILSCISVRLPSTLTKKHGNALQAALSAASDLGMALYTGSSATAFARWPQSGWILGGVADLSVLAQSASLPPEVVERAADELVAGVREAAGMMHEMDVTHHGAIHRISEELRQEDGEQTRRMAATIIANAFVFHGSLVGGPGELATIASIEELRDSEGVLKQATILAEWRKILAINFWPIFDIARRILVAIPPQHSKGMINSLARTAEKLLENRLMRSHDLTGAVFQKLIADRKFLAAYYTTPASAALIAGLALMPAKPSSKGSWGSSADVTSLRIADFACGTGTLLSAAYQRIGQLHELAGGDSEAIHPAMMASALVGCDVLPAAAHLTASMLAGVHPTMKYTKSSILTVPYGKQPDDKIKLGSLDLLESQGEFDIVATAAKAAEGMGEADRNTWASLPHGTFDLIVMNPPFTSATGHHKINKIGVPNPIFAAFKSDAEEQKLMSAATKRLTKNTSGHGNAGEATYFLVLADRKLKQSGMMGLVMPVSVMLGQASEKSRLALRKNYRDLIVISISGANGVDLSFSADTNMAECVIVGRKDSRGSVRATFVILREPVGSTLVGASGARQVRQVIEGKDLRRMEDGPVGGTPIYFGDDEIGQVLDAPLPVSGGWNMSRIADIAVGQAAYQLAEKQRIWLPGMVEVDAKKIAIALTGSIGTIGPVDRDIDGMGKNGALRGPFTRVATKAGVVPTYPLLWKHEAARERAMMFKHDSEARPRKGSTPAKQAAIDAKVALIARTASHCHFNRDFRFNSQSTAMQFTTRRTIGGRAWISVRMKKVAQEKALVLWGNTSLGLLLHWWHANKPQPGRGNITKSMLATLPTLDVSKLTEKQLAKAVKIFDETCKLELLTFHKLDVDPVRNGIDERFCKEVLRLPKSFVQAGGPLALLRMKLAQEPSIKGGKADGSEDAEDNDELDQDEDQLCEV